MVIDSPVFVLLIMVVLGVLLLGGLVASVLMLLNERTRVAGIVLLLLILVGIPVVGAGLLILGYAGMRHEAIRVVPAQEFPAPVVQGDPPMVPPWPSEAREPLVVEARDATEEFGATEDEDRAGSPDQPPAPEELDPDTTDEKSDADAKTGWVFPPNAPGRLFT